jgi:hypothetical protein
LTHPVHLSVSEALTKFGFGLFMPDGSFLGRTVDVPEGQWRFRHGNAEGPTDVFVFYPNNEEITVSSSSNKCQSFEDLEAKIAPLRAYVDVKVCHLATSDWYRVTGIHFLEADMSIVFTYQTLHRKPLSFCRPIAELLDGRFGFSG